MSKRSKLSRGGSSRYFSATADKSHRYNMNNRPMRGGTRL